MPSYAPFYDPNAKAFIRMSVNDLTQAFVPHMFDFRGKVTLMVVLDCSIDAIYS